MINPFAVGFIAVAVLAGVGVDYHQQSLRADMRLGSLGLADYAQTVTDRFAQMRTGTADESAEDAADLAVADMPEEATVPEVPVGKQTDEAEGVTSQVGGFFNRDSAGTGGTARQAGPGEAMVVQRSGQGRAGFGAGKCSYEGAIKRCTVGN